MLFYISLIYRQITTNNPTAKVYIRSPRCRYKLLAVSVKKKEDKYLLTIKA